MALPWAASAAGAAPPQVSYRIETIAGTDRMGDGGLATAAQMGDIKGVAIDLAGNIYLSDAEYHRVRKISTSGVITTVAGTGVAGFSGDGRAATDAQLHLPYGLAVDTAGFLYIADLGNDRVRRVGPNGVITTVAGNGQRGSKGENGPATEAQLLAPRNVAVDAAGYVYISEFEGHRIRRVSPGGTITTVAGTGIAGYAGDGYPAGSAQLAFPAGIAVDRLGSLYIADSQNHRIRRILSNGIIATVLGGDTGTALLTPTAVAVDIYGSIYVGDRSRTVRQFGFNGAWTTAAGNGEDGFSGDGGLATVARLKSVQDVAVDGARNIFIADRWRIRKVDWFGVISTVAGDGYLNAIGDGGPAKDAVLFRPSGVAIDPAGNVYIADTGTERVRKLTPGGIIMTAAGTGSPGYDAQQSSAGLAQLNSPSGIAADAWGNVLVADTGNHTIRRISPDGRIYAVVGTGKPALAADGVFPGLAPLSGPRGVCADSAGLVYAVDSLNHRVMRVPPAAAISMAAGNGSPGASGDDGPAAFAQLNLPGACATDSAGNLYIADTESHRIRKVSAGGIISTVAGSGLEGSSGDGGPATEARLRAPRGVAINAGGELFISDTGNHRIRKVTTDGRIQTIAGGETAAFSGDGGPATSARLNGPLGLTLDGAGNVYVADTGNNRVRRLSPELAPVVLPPATVEILHSASGQPGPVAPGQMIEILGTGIGPETTVTADYKAAGSLPQVLADCEVMFDGIPAPLLSVQAGRISAQVPYEVAAKSSTVEIRYRKEERGRAVVPVVDAAPAVFSAILNQDGSVNSVEAPASRASVITLYITGAGLSDGQNLSGKLIETPAAPRLPLKILVAGAPAQILSTGGAADAVGLMQVEARVPSGFIAPGETILEVTVGPHRAPAVKMWLK
jgi:uncharacterized protein (TIGR03437 family)